MKQLEKEAETYMAQFEEREQQEAREKAAAANKVRSWIIIYLSILHGMEEGTLGWTSAEERRDRPLEEGWA